ncbi:hypothetical protein [Solibacillus cecembensis]|uniref:hypothetical protein n=1 Tax=Solibacillus cecembensis TaxID=459347 RepID=UPI003D0639BC
MTKIKPFIVQEEITTVSIAIVYAKDAKQAQEFFEKKVGVSVRTIDSNTSISISKQTEAI